MSSSKNLTCKETLWQVFICLRPPSLLVCLVWCSNFVGSESSQIQSVKLLQNIVSNSTQHPLLVCLVWCSNLEGSESGQIQSVKLLQNIVSNSTQHPSPIPAAHCLYILNILYFDTGKGR